MPGNTLKLADEMKPGFFAGITPLAVKQSLGEIIEYGGSTNFFGVDQVEINALTDDPGILGFGWSDQFRRQFQDGIVIKRGSETFRR